VVVAQHGERTLLHRESERVLEERAVGIAEVELEMRFLSPVAGRRAAQPGRERAAVALERYLRAEQLADRRQDVDVPGERVGRACIDYARTTQDQRNVVRLIEPTELVQHVVIPEIL